MTDTNVEKKYINVVRVSVSPDRSQWTAKFTVVKDKVRGEIHFGGKFKKFFETSLISGSHFRVSLGSDR
jgi:hypothetical protein